MPAATMFLKHGRVLRAADWRIGELACHANIATYTFSDLIDTAFIDLSGKEGIGNGRSRRAYKIKDTLLDQRRHQIRRSQTTNAHNRFRSDLFDEFYI